MTNACNPVARLEVHSTRVDRGTLVVTCRLSVNRSDDPIDRIVSKRLRLLREISLGMQDEVSTASERAGCSSRIGIERFNRLLREGPLANDATHYNVDEHFSAALAQMLLLKREVIEALAFLPVNVPVVDLSSWSLKNADRVHTLCLWLQSEPSATELSLSKSDLQIEGACAIGAALRNNGTVQTLRLSRDSALPVQLLSGRSQTSAINLSRKGLGALAGCVLSELIAFNPFLETLGMHHVRIRHTPDAFNRNLRAAHTMPADLSANMLGQRFDAAVHAISDAIKASPSRLTTLKLARNYIGDEGALTLVEALSHNSIIRHLDLSSNEISSNAALQFCAKLLSYHESPNSSMSLYTITLRGNGIDEQTAAEVDALLRPCARLHAILL